MKKIGFPLSGALLAAMVVFISIMDLYYYFDYGQVWIRHRGLEPAADHPFALWIKLVFDAACLTFVIFAIVVGIRRRAKRGW